MESSAVEGQRERRGQRKAEGLIPGAAAALGAAQEEPVPVPREHSGCRGPGRDGRTMVTLPGGGHCPLPTSERANASHLLPSSSQVPPPRRPCPPARAEGGQPHRLPRASPCQLTSRGGGGGGGDCCGAALEVSVPVPSSPRCLAARKGRWGTARAGSRRGAEERPEETPGVRRTWGGEVEAGLVPGVERSVRHESRDTESREGRES